MWERATLAQLVERLIRNQQVAGSIPAGGSSLLRIKNLQVRYRGQIGLKQGMSR